jgi:anti-anti-sigma factor
MLMNSLSPALASTVVSRLGPDADAVSVMPAGPAAPGGTAPGAPHGHGVTQPPDHRQHGSSDRDDGRGDAVAVAANEQPFSADIELHDGQPHVVLVGDLDLNAVPEFFARMQEADGVGTGELVVVMHGVSLLDSSGLGVLARLAAGGVKMEIRGAHGVVRRALEIGGLDQTPNIRVREDYR